jgi:hypothetical protein
VLPCGCRFVRRRHGSLIRGLPDFFVNLNPLSARVRIEGFCCSFKPKTGNGLTTDFSDDTDLILRRALRASARDLGSSSGVGEGPWSGGDVEREAFMERRHLRKADENRGHEPGSKEVGEVARCGMWTAVARPEHYPQVARATVRILQGFEVGEKGGEVATGSAALYRAFSPGWENGCLPGVVTPGWDGTHRRCLSPKGLRPTTKHSIGH